MRTLRALLAIAALLLGACAEEPATDWLAKDWNEISRAAKGTEVRFYMYGGWAHVNKWIDGPVAARLKELHNITLVRSPMDASAFVNKLLTEKGADKAQGVIDLMWINGENFKNAKQAGLLFGPYAARLPNFQKYVDPASVATDFGFPVDGYESPYGRAQFLFEYDPARTPEPPRSFAALARWVQDNPGRFTYPQPPDFTGSAFIRQAFYAATGGHEQYLHGWDKPLFDRQAPRLWEYLNRMKPHLWQQGRSYPKDSATLDTLFARGEVDINMSYHPIHAQNLVLDGTYPDTVRTLVMAEGAIFNTHFTAIAFNAPNKPGAMVVADYLLSPEAQLSKLDPANWGDFPVLDLAKLSEEERKAFAAVDLGGPTLSPDELAGVAVPEMRPEYLEALENGWEAEVLRR